MLDTSLLPVIALVGRPNVGKSTLFNVLTKSRNALVADEPGLTRDRQYGQAHFLGEDYLIVDTGGLDTKPQKDPLTALMAKQSWQAVAEAQIILFLVDARASLQSQDIDLAKKLRKINKPVILVVNKIDGVKNAESLIAEFHRLGFPDLISIAASHQRGVLDLQQLIAEKIEREAVDSEALEALPEAALSGIKLAMIGRPNVGKSTLVNRILGEERVVVFDMPGTTRDSIFIPFERQGKHYTAIDTAGVRRRSKVDEGIEKFSVIKTLQAIKAADIVLMVFDAHEGITDQDLHLLGFVLETGRALILVINKWDGLSEYQKQRVKDQIDFKLSFVHFAKVLYISALHGTGVGDIFKWADKIYQASHQTVGTAKMTQLLEQAVAQHQPPLAKGRRVKLRYAHIGGHDPFTIVVHGTQAVALPMAYQRYLSEFYRKALGLVGTPVRLELRSPKNPYNPS
jgi:GTP-binding protein